jgi:pyridoxamine 5'-phosphate oxidase
MSTDAASTSQNIRDMRRSYGEAGLHESTLHSDPIEQFSRWLAEAALNPYIVEANAMVLSTIDSDLAGNIRPASRTVLLKDIDGENLTFFTNCHSAKGRQIHVNPHVALLFPWYAMERQVAIKGVAAPVSREITDEYFASRPWGSQIGAWASSQSEELASREVLEAAYQEYAAKYPEGSHVPTPPHWGGYVVRPTSIEFWQGRYSRLHDRLIFIRNPHDEASWEISRLYP